MPREKQKKICANGHTFVKSSECPVCPVCSSLEQVDDDFLSLFSAPARRALQSEQILTVKELSKRSRKEILALHGVGPSAIPIMEKLLRQYGLEFAQEN